MARPFSVDWENRMDRPRPTSDSAAQKGYAGARGVGFSEYQPYRSTEAQAIDRWFEDLSNYEKTLEQMAEVKLLDSFKEEMRAVDQWFVAQSDCERTTVIYALLRHCTQLQVRFFITVLQQMAKRDPIAAILSPRSSLVTPRTSTHEDDPMSQVGEKEQREFEASRRLLEKLPPLHNPTDPANDEESANTRRLYDRRTPETSPSSREPLKPLRPAPPVPLLSRDKPVPALPMQKPGVSITDQPAHAPAPVPAPVPVQTQAQAPPLLSSLVPAAGSATLQRASIAAANGRPTVGAPAVQGTATPFSFAAAAAAAGTNKAHADAAAAAAKGIAPKPATASASTVTLPSTPAPAPDFAPLPTAIGSPPISPRHSGFASQTAPLTISTAPAASHAHGRTQTHGGSPTSPSSPTSPHRRSSIGGGTHVIRYNDQLLTVPDADISAWLKSLRLHKYSNLFEHMTWEKMIDLTDDQLQEMGMTALGARRKMLKAFESIKLGEPLPKA